MAAQSVIDITSSPAPTQSRIPPSTHRLATVSASDALNDIESTSSSYIRTGLQSLDAGVIGSGTHGDGILERGKVTETWGPNGAGTTAIALQASCNVLQAGSSVVWLDCATPLSMQRLDSLLAEDTRDDSTSSGGISNFKRFSVPKLTHLLALILHPLPEHFAESTTLLVVDNLNILLDLDYPRAQAIGSSRTDAQKWQAGRRYAILGSLVTALNKLAAMSNLAVIVTTGCAMRSRSEKGLGGALAPGVGGAEWEAGVWSRAVVFRDFAGRFVGVQKSGGKSLISRDEIGDPGRIVGFDIDPRTGALRERQPSKSANGEDMTSTVKPSPVKSRKRYFDEVADSEGEDEYGWDAGNDDVFTSGNLMLGETGADNPAAETGANL